MKRFIGTVKNNIGIIEGEEFQHLKCVLRLRVDDELIIYDGSENEYSGRIIEIGKNSAKVEIAEIKQCNKLPKKNIVLFQALIKHENFEIIAQKAVELGIKTIQPFSSEYCSTKDSILKRDRLQKIIVNSTKQCECSIPPVLEQIITLDDVLTRIKNFDVVLFANERSSLQYDFSKLCSMKNIGIIVGPEGGFSEQEKNKIIESGAKSITLGNRILRSETASIVMMGIIGVLSNN